MNNMKYRINPYGDLVIYNGFNRQMFGITKNNRWIKYDYNQNGKQIYYEDSSGNIENRNR